MRTTHIHTLARMRGIRSYRQSAHPHKSTNPWSLVIAGVPVRVAVRVRLAVCECVGWLVPDDVCVGEGVLVRVTVDVLVGLRVEVALPVGV